MNFGEVARGLLAAGLASVVAGGLSSLFITSRGLRRSIVGDKEIRDALATEAESTSVAAELVAEMQWKAAVLVARSRFPTVTVSEVIFYTFGVLVTLAMPWYISELSTSATGSAGDFIGAVVACAAGLGPSVLAVRSALSRLARRFQFTNAYRGAGVSETRAGDWHIREAQLQAKLTYGLLLSVPVLSQLISVTLLHETTGSLRPAVFCAVSWLVGDLAVAVWIHRFWRPLENLSAKGLWGQVDQAASQVISSTVSDAHAGQAGQAGQVGT